MAASVKHLFLATRNSHKTREFRLLLGPDFLIDDLSRHPEVDEVEETGTSFEENARIKASAASLRIPGLIVADDSGLEVDSLGGEPGIRSARYAGEPASDVANRIKLLDALVLLPSDASRKARFRCVLVLAEAGRAIAAFKGVVEGKIAWHEQGSGGFGYDPIFQPDGSSCTFAELSAEQKNLLSHRGIAAAKLRAFLESYQADRRTQ